MGERIIDLIGKIREFGEEILELGYWTGREG